MWETTFARNSHVGLGKPINEGNMLPTTVDSLSMVFSNNVTRASESPLDDALTSEINTI